MATIEIEGKPYKVTETMSYHQAGMPAKFVETPDGERVAVKRGGAWTWWTSQDRLCPRGQCVGMSNAHADGSAVADTVRRDVVHSESEGKA
jgi:hypothetical protein